MKHPRGTPYVLAAFVALAAAGMEGCSKDDGGGPAGPGPVPRELDSGNVAGNGGFYSHTFSTAGGYPYHCSIPGHSAMVGTVTVSDSDPDTALTVNFPPSTSAFPAASVKTGGRVTWVNNTGMTHTVTSD